MQGTCSTNVLQALLHVLYSATQPCTWAKNSIYNPRTMQKCWISLKPTEMLERVICLEQGEKGNECRYAMLLHHWLPSSWLWRTLLIWLPAELLIILLLLMPKHSRGTRRQIALLNALYHWFIQMCTVLKVGATNTIPQIGKIHCLKKEN